MATSSQPKKHIIVFGMTGTGKSTLINNIAPGANLETSGSASGVTLDSTHVDTCHNGNSYRITDTAGLNEDENGKVNPQEAEKNLSKLLKDTEIGLNLMIMVTSGKILNSVTRNYKLFVDEITSNKIPVIIVQTHLEEENRAEWVEKNRETFKEAGFKAQAVVGTAFPKFNPSRESNSEWADGLCKGSREDVWTAIERFASPTPVYYFDEGGYLATFARIVSIIAKTLANVAQMTNQSLDSIQNTVSGIGEIMEFFQAFG